jgi:hypothetical protein
MRMPTLRIRLRDWRPSDFTASKRGAEKLQAIGGKAGAGSDAFQAACIDLIKFSQLHTRRDLLGKINSPLLVRAYAYMLVTHAEFCEWGFPTPEILRSLQAAKWPFSRLTFGYLARVFLNNFDTEDRYALSMLAALLMESAAAIPRKTGGDFGKWRDHRKLVFGVDGPKAVVQKAIADSADLDVVLDRIGLSTHRSSSFVQSCYKHYYIRQLESIPVGSDHPVLSELTKADVHNAIYDEGVLIGHKALEILIDRSPTGEVSEVWQRVVLSIAGDPRIGRQAASYMRWWQILGATRAQKVIGWLSQLDLKIFLEVLESSARQSGNADMQRMYPPRKVFMEGLLDQGLVVQSRLFLSRHASFYLRRNYSSEDVPEHAVVQAGQASIIYLELASGLHMIEGTHNFRLKIMDRLPTHATLMNFSKKKYTDVELRTGLIAAYLEEATSTRGTITKGVNYIDRVHRNIAWQAAAIAMLKENRVSYVASEFFNAEDYRLFKKTNDQKYWS